MSLGSLAVPRAQEANRSEEVEQLTIVVDSSLVVLMAFSLSPEGEREIKLHDLFTYLDKEVVPSQGASVEFFPAGPTNLLSIAERAFSVTMLGGGYKSKTWSGIGVKYSSQASKKLVQTLPQKTKVAELFLELLNRIYFLSKSAFPNQRSLRADVDLLNFQLAVRPAALVTTPLIEMSVVRPTRLLPKPRDGSNAPEEPPPAKPAEETPDKRGKSARAEEGS